MTDTFDDLREQASAPKPESWKPEKPDDEIAGTVIQLDDGRDKDGTLHGIIVLDSPYAIQSGKRSDERKLRSVWLLGEALRNQALRADVQPGDRVLIQYKGKATGKVSGRTYNDIRLTTDRKVSTWWDQHRKAAPQQGPVDDDLAFDDGTPFPPEPDDPPF